MKENGSDIDVLTNFRRRHCRTPGLGARGFFAFRRAKKGRIEMRPFCLPAEAAANQCHSAACPTGLLFSDALIESRIGRTTNSAIATTMKFMIAATANTACQLPV